MGANDPAMPVIPAPWGEVIDKITILQIKQRKLTGKSALAHVGTELALLAAIAAPALKGRPDVRRLMTQLRAVNRTLWKIEDDIRIREARQAFDARFVALARAVYRTNDERAALKRRISRLLDSRLVEEKLYRRG